MNVLYSDRLVDRIKHSIPKRLDKLMRQISALVARGWSESGDGLFESHH